MLQAIYCKIWIKKGNSDEISTFSFSSYSLKCQLGHHKALLVLCMNDESHCFYMALLLKSLL